MHVAIITARILARLLGDDSARAALHYVAPVGEKEQYVERAMGHVMEAVSA